MKYIAIIFTALIMSACNQSAAPSLQNISGKYHGVGLDGTFNFRDDGKVEAQDAEGSTKIYPYSAASDSVSVNGDFGAVVKFNIESDGSLSFISPVNSKKIHYKKR